MVLFAAFMGGLSGGSEKIMENNKQFAETQARQQKFLQEEFKRLSELQESSLYFNAPESPRDKNPFVVPVPENPIDVPLALQKLSGYAKAGSLWNNRENNPSGWQKYRDSFVTLLGEGLRYQIDEATNEGVDVAVSIPDFVSTNRSSFDRLYNAGVSEDEINSMITATASTVLREVTQDELASSYLFYRGPNGQIKSGKVTTNLPPSVAGKLELVGENATRGTKDKETGIGYTKNAVETFTNQHPIFDNEKDQNRLADFLFNLNEGYRTGKVRKGLRTFVFTDPRLEKEMLEIYDTIGPDPDKFQNLTYLMTASISDDLGIYGQKLYVNSDRIARKEFQEQQALSFVGEDAEQQKNPVSRGHK